MRVQHRILALSAFLAVSAGCRQKQTEAPAKPARPSVQNLPQYSAAPDSQPVADFHSDPLYQQADALSRTDIHRSMELLEVAIAKSPEGPTTAPYYLLLGSQKKKFEGCQFEYLSLDLEDRNGQCADFRQYASARPNEYWFNEIGDDYLYQGFHFKELEKHFPSSPLAVEAGYQLTYLARGGECEGYVDCNIEVGFAPVRDFLKKYPDSRYTAEAVRRADDAFRKVLWGQIWKTDSGEITDVNKQSEFYDPADLKKLVQEYEDVAETIPVRFRASALETIAYYRGKFGEKDRASALYERILKENPEYENLPEIRKRLAALR